MAGSDDAPARSKDGETMAIAAPGAWALRGAVPPIPPETTVGWADTVWRHGTEPGAKLRWLGERLPTLRRDDALESLVSPYVTSWGARADVTAVLRSGARLHRLDGLHDGGLARLAKTYERYGWAWEAYRSFGVWHEGLGDWDAYWSRRPGRLRETVRRKGRGARAMLVDAEAAKRAVARVAPSAWQGEEPHPGFVPAVIERGAAEGWARTYVLDAGIDRPAVQLWLVGGGRASLAKTWHDADAAPRSPGTVLTARVIEALAGEGIGTVDFGRGDDPYKADWAAFRTQRWGLTARPAATPAGVALGARRRLKRVLRRG